MYVVLLGPPGAGKGTQSARLAQQLGLVHISSGDLFRQAVERGDDLGKRVKKYLDGGVLVPDDITVAMMLRKLEAADSEGGAVIDGFPRNLRQAESLDRGLAEQGRWLDVAIYLKVPQDELVRRLSGRWVCRNCQRPYHYDASAAGFTGECDHCGGELYQRVDDLPDTIEERLQVYLEQTTPLIDYYRKQNKLASVDGKGSPEEVFRRLLDAIKDMKLV